MVIVKQRKKEQKIIHKKIKPCKKLQGFFMCYTKIFQSCPFACRWLLLSKQTIVGGLNRQKKGLLLSKQTIHD